MSKSLLLCVFPALISCFAAHASNDGSCHFKSVLTHLTLNSKVTLREGEKLEFGTVLKSGTKIPKLSDGTHVFILDAEQNLVISPRFPDFDEVTPVVTHRSLLNRLRARIRKEPNLIALGEINIDHGMVSSINNKAGTAFMSNESLPEMARVLKERGLPITPETPLVPFDQVQRGHDSEHLSAAFRIETEKDPQLKVLNEKLISFRRKIQKRFPLKDSPGQVDWVAFLSSQKGKVNGIKLNSVTKPQFAMLSSLSWLENFADRYRVLPVLKKQMTPSELDELIENLPRFEGAFYLQ